MTKTIYADQDLAYLFDEYDNEKNGKLSKEKEKELKLYKLDNIQAPERGDVVSAKFLGIQGDQYVFNVNGYKDDIRMDVRQNESKYLKNTSIGDFIDVLISEVDNENFMIKGSISTLYESRARQT